MILDDAIREIYYPQLVPEVSNAMVMQGLPEVVESKGLFCSLYSDGAAILFTKPKPAENVDKSKLTQVGQALKELGMKMIPAYSPQARGRSEQNFATSQNRLTQARPRFPPSPTLP